MTFKMSKSKTIGDRSGTMELEFDINDTSILGTASFAMVEQGWTVKLPGTITGVYNPKNGNVTFATIPKTAKYAGKDYPYGIRVTGVLNGDRIVCSITYMIANQQHTDEGVIITRSLE